MIVQVKNARLGFHDLEKPKAVNDGDPKYSATLICSDDTEIIVTKPDGSKAKHPHTKFKNVVEAVLKGKWPAIKEGAKKKIKIWCYNQADGSYGCREEYTNDDGDYYAGFDEDTYYITAAKRGDKMPNGMTCLNQRKQPLAASAFYSGCYVNAIVDVYAIERKDGNTISASLEGIQFVRNGEALGFVSVDAASEFDEEEVDDADVIGNDEPVDGDDDGLGLAVDLDDIPF